MAVTLVALALPGTAKTQDRDPAARGLDVFVHVPTAVPSGGVLPVLIEAFGFPSVQTAEPLSDADVQVVWDPEYLGPHVAVAPAPLGGKTLAKGRLILNVPVPRGDAIAMRLLVRVRHGDHERVRTVTVQRTSRRKLQLFVGDTHVVPGSTISTWVLVENAITKKPVAQSDVVVKLVEGGVSRFERVVRTDRAGAAMVRVPIPRTTEPAWTWELIARLSASPGEGSASASVTLRPREETPGTPSFRSEFLEPSIRPGERATLRLNLRDASNRPLAAAPVRVWIGPKGTNPPEKDEDWKAAPQAPSSGHLPLGQVMVLRTDLRGLVQRTVQAPPVVSPVGTKLTLRARVDLSGQELKSSSSLRVGRPETSVTLSPEAGSIVPGVKQHMLISMHDERFDPVVGRFSVRADGLDIEVTTDEHGEAEVLWNAPKDVGALRDFGACAGGVASAVIVRPLGAGAGPQNRMDPFELCVGIDRDAEALVATDRKIVRAGQQIEVKVLSARDRSWSLLLERGDGRQSTSAWLDSGNRGAHITVPADASGVWTVSAVSPGSKTASVSVGAGFLVLPTTLPRLSARIVGGRQTPGGKVEIEAHLTDEAGKGLQGSVAAVVIDRFGGGSVAGLESLDTRHSLCSDIGAWKNRCAAVLDEGPAADALRRGLLGDRGESPTGPSIDPGLNVETTLAQSFRAVVQSLEGAVFVASASPERLRDVRRKGKRGWEFNPELMTLAVEALGAPPMTPGGEALSLSDLIAIDSQVTFDNVARRITRLKVFNVLKAVRSFKLSHELDDHEPALRNPNALLRRLVREDLLTDGDLLDPWGGTIQFAKTGGPVQPFLTVTKGWSLRAPGPDRRLNTGDDIRDPFERVLKSGTPYAEAVHEDRLVDLRWELKVGDATVAHWDEVLQALTGNTFGAGGLGLSGVGTGGGGSGFGSGHGRLGRSRRHRAISTGDAFWSPPRRTDAEGKVRFVIPLGDIETTWRVALIGLPDDASPATTRLDVESALPLSTRVEAGAAWVERDSVEVVVSVRNRKKRPADVTIALRTSGVAELVGAPARSIRVPAGGERVLRVQVQAPKAGKAGLAIRTSAPGFPADELEHTWRVRRAGEVIRRAHVEWVDEERDLSQWLERDGLIALGAPRLVIERGMAHSIEAALESLDPDGLTTMDSMVDAVETSGLVHRWALRQGTSKAHLVKRTLQIGEHAMGRFRIYKKLAGKDADWNLEARINRWGPIPVLPERIGEPFCPAEDASSHSWLPDIVDGLDAEPAPQDGSILPCWGSFASEVVQRVRRSDDPDVLARAVLALAARAHRSSEGKALAQRLRNRVRIKPSGRIEMPRGSSRSDRALVYSALLVGTQWQRRATPSVPKLAAWLAVQRDPTGGFGSSLATRAAVRAMLWADEESADANAKKTQLEIEIDGTTTELAMGPHAREVVKLPSGTKELELEPDGPGVVTRIERRFLRPWSRPPSDASGPLRLSVTWPEAKLGRTAALEIEVRHLGGGERGVDVRVPLPPGVSLAAPIAGVRQVQGSLMVRLDVDEVAVPLTIPVRFGLRGKVTVPEANARLRWGHAPRAVAPARKLTIQ